MCFFFFFPGLKKNCPSQREGLRSLDAATVPAALSPRSRAKWDGGKEKDTGSEDRKEGGQLESKGDKLDQDPEEYLSGPSCCGVDNGQCAQCICPFLLSGLLLREQRKNETIVQLWSRLHACIRQCAWRAEWQSLHESGVRVASILLPVWQSFGFQKSKRVGS